MNFFFATFFGFFLAVQASPWVATRATRDVGGNFTIITPNFYTTWYLGKSANVTWYVMSSRQKVLITESPTMIQGMPPKKLRTVTRILTTLLLSSCLRFITRKGVRVLSDFCRSFLLTSITSQTQVRSQETLIFALGPRASMFTLIYHPAHTLSLVSLCSVLVVTNYHLPLPVFQVYRADGLVNSTHSQIFTISP